MPTGPNNKTPGAARTLGRVGIGAAIAAAAACYGALAVVSFLGLVGLQVAVNEAAWSGTILVLTGLAVLVVLAGARRHRSPAPGAAALVGGGLIAYALLIEYVFYLELAGFVALGTAAYYDFQLHRRLPTARIDPRSQTDRGS